MAHYSFNSLLDRWKNRIYGVWGDTSLRDHMLRSQVNYVDWDLTAAQMDALNATPVTLLAAPGSGYMNIVHGGVTFIDAGATAFELGAGVLSFLYTDASGAKTMTDVPNTTVESATDTYYRSVGLAVVPVSNAPIVAFASADVTAGDGALYGRIFYSTIYLNDLTFTNYV